MKKIIPGTKTYYSEEGQTNPIKWCLLQKQTNTDFKMVSDWFKCKDFLNDVVVAYKKKQFFTIYAFTAPKECFPRTTGKFYIGVSKTTTNFQHNLTILNEWLPEKITLFNTEDKKSFILGVGKYYFQNTYRISMLSLAIRICNYEVKFESVEDMLEWYPNEGNDVSLWGNCKKSWVLPTEDIWVASSNITSLSYKPKGNDYQLKHYVHNSGVKTWQTFFEEFYQNDANSLPQNNSIKSRTNCEYSW